MIGNRSLQELSQHGLVKMRKAGRSILYSLNKDHILVNEILIPIFLKEKKLFSSLIKVILASLPGTKPISIVLFGSQIDQKNARPDSDFDILCIIPNETNLKRFKSEVAQSEAQIEKKFGNRASLLIMKKNEFLKRKEKADPLLLNIEKKSKLLFGRHLREIK